MNSNSCIQDNSSSINKTMSGSNKYPSELLVVNFIISISIIAMNLMVFSVFILKKKTVLISPSNWLLVSLSFCDLLKGVGVIFILVKEMDPVLKTPSTTFGYTYRILVDVYNTFVVEAIVMHLCGLTLDRHIALFHTYRYDTIVTIQNVSRYILCCWLFSFLASSIQFSWLYDVLIGNHCKSHLQRIASYEIWYSLASFIIFLAIPTALLGVAFSAMFMKIRCIISRLPENNPRRAHQSVSSRQLRVLYAFGAMSLCFGILVMPYFSLRLALDITMWRGDKANIKAYVFHTTFITKNMTSLINPLLYAGTCPKFQAVLKQLVCSTIGLPYRAQTTQKPLVLEMQTFSPNVCGNTGSSLLRLSSKNGKNKGCQDEEGSAFL